MKVLIVSHYFPPEIGAPQARLSELARLWAAEGEDVTVLTGMPNHPTGVVHPRYRRRVRMLERLDGYRIVRTWLYATPNEGIVKKTLGHLSFMLSSIVLGLRAVGSPDIVVVSSPTFFSIFSAWFIARARRAKLVVEVRDLWPGIFIELGVLRNRQVIWLLERLELAAYRSAAHVVVVTDGFREDLLRRGVPASKVTTITNGVDLERFAPQAASEDDRRWLGAAPGTLLVLYIGAHGVSHGLSSIVRAADLLQNDDVHVAFVGEGADKENVVAVAEQLGTSNVTFHDGVPRDRVPALLAAADVCLVPLRDVPLFSSFIPSKMFEYMAAGRPIVGSVAGEAASILTNAGAIVTRPEDPTDLAQAIGALAADRTLLRAMAEDERQYVTTYYDRSTQAAEYRRLLHQLLR